MWFRLAIFPNDKPDLCGIVGKDGNIYWRLTDIGRFLGYKNPYTFAIDYRNKKRHARYLLRIKEVVPPIFHCTHPEVKLVTFAEMSVLMSTRNYRFDIDYLRNVWLNGRILLPQTKMQISPNYQDSIRLIVDYDGIHPTIPLQEFISNFTNYVMDYYDKIVKENKFCCISTESNMGSDNLQQQSTENLQQQQSNEVENLQQQQSNEVENLQQQQSNENLQQQSNENLLPGEMLEQSMAIDGETITLSSSEEEELMKETVDPDNIYIGCDGLEILPKSIYLMCNGITYNYEYVNKLK